MRFMRLPIQQCYSMINHRQLEAFNALIAMGTTVKAAELLGISQPAVSRLIKQLESETKLLLFDRDGGGMRPTREGTAFHREVDRAFLSLRKLELIAHEIRTHDTGQLRVGALPALGFSFLPQIVTEFSRSHPNTLLKIESTSSTTIRDVIASGQFDLGFVADEVDIAGLIAERFAAPPVVCVLPPNHPLAEKAVIDPTDLHDVPFISLSRADRTRRRIDALFGKLGISRRIVIETHFALSICHFAASGLGVGLVNPYTLGAISPGQVVARAFWPRINFNTMMIYPAERPMTPAVKAFRRLAHNHAVPVLENILNAHGVIRDEESKRAVGQLAAPGPWIRNPRNEME